MDVTQAITDAGSAFAGFSLALSLPTILRVLFTVLVMFTMRGKLARVNMVESLKSIE